MQSLKTILSSIVYNSWFTGFPFVFFIIGWNYWSFFKVKFVILRETWPLTCYVFLPFFFYFLYFSANRNTCTHHTWFCSTNSYASGRMRYVIRSASFVSISLSIEKKLDNCVSNDRKYPKILKKITLQLTLRTKLSSVLWHIVAKKVV